MSFRHAFVMQLALVALAISPTLGKTAPRSEWMLVEQEGEEPRLVTTRRVTVFEGQSEPALMCLEVRRSGEVRLSALSSRAYHERFFTNDYPTHLSLNGVEYVPFRDFLNDGADGSATIAASEEKPQEDARPFQFASRNHFQLAIAGEPAADFLRAAVEGRAVEIEFVTLMGGKKHVRFSMQGLGALLEEFTFEQAAAAPAATAEQAIERIVRELPADNRFGVTRAELRVITNPSGGGHFVYAPETRYGGVERVFIWFVYRERPFKLNGATHNLTPDVPFPNVVTGEFWEGSGVDEYSVTPAGLRAAFPDRK